MGKIKHTFSELENSTTYYGKVFTVNPNNRINSRADLTVFAAVTSSFPNEPTSYDYLINTYTTSMTWVAPEDGYFRVMAFGSSGAGTNATVTRNNLVGTNYSYKGTSGNGGGGGAYSCSDIKMNKGDTVKMTIGAASATTTIVITSTTGEVYSTMTLVGGQPGSGTREGGTASGGNVANANGTAGGTGSTDSIVNDNDLQIAGGSAGKAGHASGNAGGAGGAVVNAAAQSGGAGKAAFVRIYRGNTNVVG